MSEVVGKMIICDRCGDTTFVKYLDTKALDGGFTRFDKFEKVSDGWHFSTELGKMLCPECNSLWQSIKNQFINGGKQ